MARMDSCDITLSVDMKRLSKMVCKDLIKQIPINNLLVNEIMKDVYGMVDPARVAAKAVDNVENTLAERISTKVSNEVINDVQYLSNSEVKDDLKRIFLEEFAKVKDSIMHSVNGPWEV